MKKLSLPKREEADDVGRIFCWHSLVIEGERAADGSIDSTSAIKTFVF